MKKLDPRIIKINIIAYSLSLLFFAAIITFFTSLIRLGHGPEKGYEVIFFKTWLFQLSLSLLVVIILGYLLAHYAYKHYSYELRNEGYYQISGIFFKHWLSIPYDRIQNVDIKQGPLMRLVDLYSVVITTAGMRGAGKYAVPLSGVIHGVTLHDAEALRTELLKKTR